MKRIRVCTAQELAPGSVTAACDGERRFAVYNVDGQWFATDDECTHGKASLSEEGRVDGGAVICGWHGGRFTIATGKPLRFPATKPLRTYEVHEIDGELFVDVEETP